MHANFHKQLIGALKDCLQSFAINKGINIRKTRILHEPSPSTIFAPINQPLPTCTTHEIFHLEMTSRIKFDRKT